MRETSTRSRESTMSEEKPTPRRTLGDEEYARLLALQHESEQALAEIRAILADEAARGDAEAAAILGRWTRLDAIIAARRS
jgi:hypothetical protein